MVSKAFGESPLGQKVDLWLDLVMDLRWVLGLWLAFWASALVGKSGRIWGGLFSRVPHITVLRFTRQFSMAFLDSFCLLS